MVSFFNHKYTFPSRLWFRRLLTDTLDPSQHEGCGCTWSHKPPLSLLPAQLGWVELTVMENATLICSMISCVRENKTLQPSLLNYWFLKYNKNMITDRMVSWIIEVNSSFCQRKWTTDFFLQNVRCSITMADDVGFNVLRCRADILGTI